MHQPEQILPGGIHSYSIGSHNSDSQLGTTRVVSGARMLMYLDVGTRGAGGL